MRAGSSMVEHCPFKAFLLHSHAAAPKRSTAKSPMFMRSWAEAALAPSRMIAHQETKRTDPRTDTRLAVLNDLGGLRGGREGL